MDALATGPGHLEVTELTMNSSVSHHFLESNVSPWWKQVMQQDNNAKTQAKTFSPDLKVTEMVWWDVKRVVYKQIPDISSHFK